MLDPTFGGFDSFENFLNVSKTYIHFAFRTMLSTSGDTQQLLLPTMAPTKCRQILEYLQEICPAYRREDDIDYWKKFTSM